MIKDESKNKISMALKDPILQQGFEIICKENAELKELIKNMSYEYQRLCLIKKETLTEAEQFLKDSEVEK